MPENRILPLVGAAATLYLIADAYVRAGSLSPLDSFVAIVAALIGLAPLLAQRLRRERVRTHRAFTWLTAALGLTVGSTLGAYELYQIIGSSSAIVAAGFLLDLALSEPDRVPGHRRLRLLNLAAFALLFGLNFFARTEFEGALPIDLLLPAHFEIEPGEILLVSASLSLLLRMARRRLGSTPKALAANAWGVLTLGLTAPFFLGETLIRRGAYGARFEDESPAFLLALAAAGLSLGHLAVFFEERRLVSGASLRRILAFALPLFLFSGVAAIFAAGEGYDPLQAAAVAAGILVGGALLARLLRKPIRLLFAPNGGRLLDAIDEALSALHGSATLDDLAAAALTPLRDHHESASPILALRDPGRVYRLDAAGLVRGDDRELPEALCDYLDDPAAGALFSHGLEARAVRDPESRPLLEALRGYQAEVIIPCPADGENQGALLFSRDSHGLPQSMEELRALDQLGARIGARLVAFQAARRSNEHIHEALLQRERLEGELRALRERLETLEVIAHAPPAHFEAPLVAYSPAMRAAVGSLSALSEGPIALITPQGGPDKAIAREAHERVGQGGPFVIYTAGARDESGDKDEDALGALLGREGETLGAIARAHCGTLFIRAIERLDKRAQRVLGEAIRERHFRAIGGEAIRPLELRLIVSAGRSIDELIRAGAIDRELARAIGDREIRIPPLSERAEDLDSLFLLAIDRAASALGKESPGLFEETATRLRAGPFPGDERGLRWRLYAAVASAEGAMLEPSSLALRDDPERESAPIAQDEPQLPKASASPERATEKRKARKRARRSSSKRERAEQGPEQEPARGPDHEAKQGREQERVQEAQQEREQEREQEAERDDPQLGLFGDPEDRER